MSQTSERNAHGFSRALEKNEVATLTKKSAGCKLGLKREKKKQWLAVRILALSQLMSNVEGLTSNRRHLFMTATTMLWRYEVMF